MGDALSESYFALEALLSVALDGGKGPDELQRNQGLMEQVGRGVDLTHSTSSEETLNAVALS
jgi:hypothetical protein